MVGKYKNIYHWRNKSVERALDAFGNRCGICGYNKCTRALCFHHVDPSKKEFKLRTFRSMCISWERIVKELRNCVLLCANCHMEVHDGITQIPEDIRKFDESFAVYINWQGRVVGDKTLL